MAPKAGKAKTWLIFICIHVALSGTLLTIFFHRKTPPGVQELIPNLPTRVEDIENRSIHSASQQSRFQSSFEDFTNSFTQSLLKSNQYALRFSQNPFCSTAIIILIFLYRPPSQPGIQPKDDNTITLYPGAPSEGSLSPPAQVVRHQLVVTDNNAGMQNGQGTNQLQLPQKPTPPMGLPKPVPAQAKVPPLPVQPKTIPGKVAVCPNCGGYSVHIDRCQMCKKVIKEGAKIMPDPDYKPPITSSSSSLDDSKKPPQDLRNIRIQPKVGRRKTNNDEPEMISLSSDEEDANEDDNEAENGESRTSSNENTSSSVNDSGDKSEASKTEDGKSFSHESKFSRKITDLKINLAQKFRQEMKNQQEYFQDFLFHQDFYQDSNQEFDQDFYQDFNQDFYQELKQKLINQALKNSRKKHSM